MQRKWQNMNKAASPQPLHKIIVYFELMQSGKKKQDGYWRTEIFDFVLRRMQQQPDELLSQSRDDESLVATAFVTPMCVSATGGKFCTDIQLYARCSSHDATTSLYAYVSFIFSIWRYVKSVLLIKKLLMSFPHVCSFFFHLPLHFYIVRVIIKNIIMIQRTF